MAEDIRTSSKFKTIISKSDVVQKGSPTCYKLITRTETIGTLTRVTFGDRKNMTINKTILLVGETGAGKSTLINTLVNYCIGVKFEDEIWFQIVEDERRCQTQSQTSDVMVYEVFGFEGRTLPYSLTIIDTPGYGSTEPEQDIIVSQRLFDLFRSQNGVHEVDVVGLVMKTSECRLSDRLIYILNSVMSLFGKNMEENIVALITHSNGITPKNVLKALEAANVKYARNENDQPVYFLFDNCQDQNRAEENETLDHAAKISQRGIRQFTDFVEKSTPQSMDRTIAVLNERIRLAACIQNLQDRVNLAEQKQKEIRQIRKALKKHGAEMKKNEQFTVEVDEVYKDKVTIHGGMWGLVFFEAAVCCKFCEENCHYPGCTMAWRPNDCEVMKGGRCTVCSRKCLASAHVKENWIYVTKTRRVQKTLTEVKEQYEKNKAANMEAETLLEDLQKEMTSLEADKAKWLDEVYQHAVTLDQIALNVDSLSTHVHFKFLIEKMEKLDITKVQKLKEMASRANEQLQTAVAYAFERMVKWH